MNKYISKYITYFTLGIFVASQMIFSAPVKAQELLNLPAVGTKIMLTESFNPAMMQGLAINPTDPFQIDFFIDEGDDALQGEALQKEATKLIKYFMTSLTVPEEDMWVNLSPYEANRIVADDLGQTEMGRDLLAQDYMLKQLVASLMNPKDELGKAFWDRIYDQAMDRYGTTDIPVDTYNKIWIVPDRAKVFINGSNVVVVDSHLKVMLEEDYLALDMNKGRSDHGLGVAGAKAIEKASVETSAIVRDLLIPEIEREVNHGQTFANLRQMANAMILATWYKINLKESVLNSIYVNQNKVDGVEVQDPQVSQKIYERYVQAFQKGVFNFIEEEYNPATQEVMPRKYFSGGVQAEYTSVLEEVAQDETPAMSVLDRIHQFTTRLAQAGEENRVVSRRRILQGATLTAAVAFAGMEEGGAVSRDAVRFLQNDEKELGAYAYKGLSTFADYEKAYNEFVDEMIRKNKGTYAFKVGETQFVRETKFKLVQDIIAGLGAGVNPTFDQVAAKLREYFAAQYDLQAKGKLSTAQLNELASNEIKAVHWLMTMLMRDSGTEYDPTLSDKAFFRRDGAHTRFVIYNERNKKKRTHLCETATEQMVVLAYEIGLREEMVTYVDPVVDDKGKVYPDPVTGIGHANVLIKPVAGRPFIMDQGFTSFNPFHKDNGGIAFEVEGGRMPISYKLDHWQFFAWDKDGKGRIGDMTNFVKKGQDFNGLTFTDLISDQDAQIERFKIKQKLNAKKPKDFTVAELKGILKELMDLSKYPLAHRRSMTGNIFRLHVGTDILNTLITMSNLARSKADVFDFKGALAINKELLNVITNNKTAIEQRLVMFKSDPVIAIDDRDTLYADDITKRISALRNNGKPDPYIRFQKENYDFQIRFAKVGKTDKHMRDPLVKLLQTYRQRATDPEIKDEWVRKQYSALANRVQAKINDIDKALVSSEDLDLDAAVSVNTSEDRYGGIDFNANNLKLEQVGQTMQFMTFELIDPYLDIEGMKPVIINVAPVANPGLIFGLHQNSPQEEQVSRLN